MDVDDCNGRSYISGGTLGLFNNQEYSHFKKVSFLFEMTDVAVLFFFCS